MTIAINDSNLSNVADLIVRRLEESVVRRLREEAAREGVSAEELHRRLLRRSLLKHSDGRQTTFKEYLLTMPVTDEDSLLPDRRADVPRPIDL